jgi:hypothetical protein
MTPAAKVEAVIARVRATLDQLEEHARGLRPHYLRLVSTGPDGSPEDTWLARTAAENLVLLIDTMRQLRAAEVLQHQLELVGNAAPGADRRTCE